MSLSKLGSSLVFVRKSGRLSPGAMVPESFLSGIEGGKDTKHHDGFQLDIVDARHYRIDDVGAVSRARSRAMQRY